MFLMKIGKEMVAFRARMGSIWVLVDVSEFLEAVLEEFYEREHGACPMWL